MNDNRIPNEFEALLNERDAMIEAALGAEHALGAAQETAQIARLLEQTREPDTAEIVPLKKRAHRPGRRFLILAAAILLTLILLGSTIAVEPVRHYILNRFDGTNIIFKNEYVEDSLKERFNYIPAGFALVKEEHDRLGNLWYYKDEYGNRLNITTSENGGNTFINTEGVGYEEVEIQGHTGLYVERPGDCLMLVWTTGKYHHAVIADLTETSRVTREDMFKIANEREIVSTRNNKTKDSLKESYPYIPQGYTLEKEEHDRKHNYYLYADENQNELVISTMKNGSVVSVNSEEVGVQIVIIQGQTGFLTERDNGLILVWSTGKYTHRIVADITETANISREDVLRIASSREIK